MTGHEAERSDGVAEIERYASERGVVYAPRSIDRRVRRTGRVGTRTYIDDLGAIMDAAASLQVGCSQLRAARLLSQAQGNPWQAILELVAERRRRTDRRPASCCVAIVPRAPRERINALAGCGCMRCRERLAHDMLPFIRSILARRLFSDIDRTEAEGEANLQLLKSVDSWPGGGDFIPWFATQLTRRACDIYRSRSPLERTMLSLDAAAILDDDQGGRLVPLAERVTMYSISVLTIVIRREQLAEKALAQRSECAERCEEYDSRRSAPSQPGRCATLRSLPGGETARRVPPAPYAPDRRAA